MRFEENNRFWYASSSFPVYICKELKHDIHILLLINYVGMDLDLERINVLLEFPRKLIQLGKQLVYLYLARFGQEAFFGNPDILVNTKWTPNSEMRVHQVSVDIHSQNW